MFQHPVHAKLLLLLRRSYYIDLVGCDVLRLIGQFPNQCGVDYGLLLSAARFSISACYSRAVYMSSTGLRTYIYLYIDVLGNKWEHNKSVA